jgi:putative tricarboxylic transport membrane protein
MVLAPPLAEFAIRFGPAEYTSLLVVGLIVLAYMSGGSMLKMLAMAALGLLCGMVGMDVMSGYARFTGGVIELRDGLGIVPVAVGLFGISEIMLSAARAREVAVRQPRLAELVPTRAELGAAVAPIARGSVLGFLIGIIPGSAHIISSFVSYGIERRVSKTPERFGHGAVAGVAGPESANNAAASGAFVPMLALGVPSGPIPAVMLAAIMIHGVVPGPLLIAERPEIFWGFIASMYIGNVVLLILNLPLVGLFIQVLRIPYRYLYPLILTLCVLGVYAVGQSVVDVWIMIVMGLVGYAMRKLGYEPAPLVLGMVIAPQLELSFRQALALSGGSYSIFVTRPVSAVLLALAVVLLALSLRSALTQHADWRRQLGLEERV